MNQYRVVVHRLESAATGETIGVDLTLYWPKKSCEAYFTSENGQSFKRGVILRKLPTAVDMTTGDTERDPDTIAMLKEAFTRWRNDVLVK